MAIVLTDKLQNGIAGSGLIDAASIDTTNNNKTQQEVNNDLLGRTGADISINGTDTGISIEQAISSVTSALNNLKGEDIPLSSINPTKIATAIAELANAINAISLTTANVTEGTGESQTNQETINEGFRKKTANLNSSGELPSSKVTEGTGATKKTQAEINVEFRDKTLRLTGSGTLNALYVNDTTRNKTQKAINDELYNALFCPIVDVASGTTSINCSVDTYYKVFGTVNTLALNLPSMSGVDVVRGITVAMTTGTTPNISIVPDTGIDVLWLNSEALLPNTRYELSILWNGLYWSVSYNSLSLTGVINLTTATSYLEAQIDKYYNFTQDVTTLEIVLPAVSSGSYLRGISFIFSTSSSATNASVQFTSADNTPILYFEDYYINASKTYEINAMYNGTKWVLSYGVVS